MVNLRRFVNTWSPNMGNLPQSSVVSCVFGQNPSFERFLPTVETHFLFLRLAFNTVKVFNQIIKAGVYILKLCKFVYPFS